MKRLLLLKLKKWIKPSVKHALDYSKNILVNPMDLDSNYKGNNKLIKEGADVLVSINDLVDN